MKTILGVFLLLNGFLWANEPELKLTGKDSYNGFATVAGVVHARDVHQVRVSVRCGNTTYTTVPDANGRWAIVFRHTHFNFNVNAWYTKQPEEPLAFLSDSLRLSD